MTKAITCMKCGAPLQLTNPEVRTVKCEFCDVINQLDTEQNPAKMGKFVPKKTSAGPLKVGMQGNFRGQQPFTISGLLEYSEDGDTWYEYMCEFSDGTLGWLQYDDGDWIMYFKKQLKTPVPPGVRANSRINVNGMSVTVEEVGTARITHVEGQIPFAVDYEDDIDYIDGCTEDDKAISIEIAEDEVELFVGREVNRRMLGV